MAEIERQKLLKGEIQVSVAFLQHQNLLTILQAIKELAETDESATHTT